MEASPSSAENIVKTVYAYAAELMKSGLEGPQIQSKLEDQGLDPETAGIVVRNLQRARTSAKRSSGRKNMLFGALWCIGGIVVTAATYSAASGGGTYVIAWGAIAAGAVQFFLGVSQSAA